MPVSEEWRAGHRQLKVWVTTEELAAIKAACAERNTTITKALRPAIQRLVRCGRDSVSENDVRILRLGKRK